MEEKDDSINPEENFSDDPTENLHIENEILKLKMQAEWGALFGESGNLPPEMENAFLQQVQEFEQAWQNAKYVKVYDLIGKPVYKKEQELSDAELSVELKRLFHLLESQNINLAVLGDYEPRTIYRFITEELFEHETDDVQLPGMTKNFTYEEFHPNHKMDIHERAMEFLEHWFERGFNEYSWELNDPFILPDGTTLLKQNVLKRINSVFQSYTSFSNCQYALAETSFQWDDAERGLGYAEGGVKYDAVLENGEIIHMEGPFKLYLSNENNFWSIFYFVFPGFSW